VRISFIKEEVPFGADYERLCGVSLNPLRHVAANAHEHCELVRERVVELAGLNGCGEAETALLADLARVHDIGKLSGTSRPEEAVALLSRYGVTDEQLINLVKYHDINLAWHIAARRGEPPGDKAWRKLASRLDLRLLCIFMVADRVDCPGGWRRNEALVWFLGEVERRRLLPTPLVLNDGPVLATAPSEVEEVSAGCVLVHDGDGGGAASLAPQPETR